MKQKLLILFLVLLGLEQSISVMADQFLQEPSGYTAIVQGIDRIRFTLPTQYDGNQNEGIRTGSVYVSEDGGAMKELLVWGMGDGYNNLTSDKESGQITVNAKYGGEWQLVGKVKGGHRYFQNNTDVTFTVAPNDDNDDHFTTMVDWTVPRELRGKRLTFRLWCRSEDISHSWFIPSGVSDRSSTYQMCEWDCPPSAEVSITMNEPMLSYDAAHAGSIMIPYSIQAKSVQSAIIYYTDVVSGEKKSAPLSTKLVDFAFLPADRPLKDIKIWAMIKDTENKDVTITSTESFTSKMIHFPENLTARVQPDGKVKLTWTVSHDDAEDFDDSDNFEVQRNVKGLFGANDEGWTTIDMEKSFVRHTSTYSIIDSTLLDRYEDKPVAYRVRRSSTTIWRWVTGSGYSMSIMPPVLALPAFTEAFVQRTDTWNDEEHLVKFNYTTGSKYDNQGRFIVRTDADWEEFMVMHNKAEKVYADAVMVLMDESDWKKFALRVNFGATTLNAVMLTDIDLHNTQDNLIGDADNPYEGTFNGLGNTLTIDRNGNNGRISPFGVVASATISNLTVAGTITTPAKFVGGLVGRVMKQGSLKIERCQVNVDLNSQVDGDASSGGLIGIMEESSSVDIKNTAFTGSINGDKTNSNGGFIGVALGNTTVNMSNCLFAPSSLPFNAEGCNTFVRYDKTATLNITNCYYTAVYGQYKAGDKAYYVLQKDKDWAAFSEIVAQGNAVNAILAADITANIMVGTNDKPFTGIFDGNGHTLTLNIKGNSAFTAPFSAVGNAEIKNLRVKGIVEGGNNTGGLIGQTLGGNTVTISNVHVSADITASANSDRILAAGFISNGYATAHILNNCRFDGTITADGGSTNYAAAFIGCVLFIDNDALSNCYEKGTYNGFANTAYCYYSLPLLQLLTPWSTGDGGHNNYSAHDWTEMGNNMYRNVADDSGLASDLGFEWTFKDNMAVPFMTTAGVSNLGTSAVAMTDTQLRAALGNETWREGENGVCPVMDTTVDNHYIITLWDRRAKLILQVKMQTGKGTETSEVDLSGNPEAVQKHEFTYNLTRKCVDYDFNLIVRRGTSPLKIAGSTLAEMTQPVTKKETGDQAVYKFMNMNQITSVTPQKKQSSVRLTWGVSGGETDFYRVLRRPHSTDADAEWTDTVATDLVQQYYEDKKVLAQQAYDYRVESILQCEGLHIASAEVMGAECEPTGRVSGYVRMADGTALGDIKVACTPKGSILGAQTEYIVYTDDAGFFEFKGLPYQSNGRYQIFVGDGGYTGPNDEGLVSFTQSSNWTQNFNYFMDNYYVYSGNVYYRDTSIPVPGVSFKLDGNVMHDASQQVITTDNQGAFELSIPAGQHSVQAVKEGHYFANNGFLINKDATIDPTQYNFEKNVASVLLWDSTTVVLRGRVVGGDVQGSMPLGQSLSKNNLGDSLRIVMQLEGDNTSYLIRKQDDETVKSASYKVAFGLDQRDTTQVNITRHTLTIKPDNKTGEFQLTLHPAKYKVIEVSAQGFPTLFQQGKVGETLDLMFNVRGDTCEYNCIYHAVPTVDVRQFNPGDEPYFGVKRVTASDNIGNKAVINTWYWKKTSATDSVGVYSFNYPVFMANSPYGWILQACEKYYYNNKVSANPDIVNLKGGKVSINNGLVSASDTKELQLDEDGSASYVFTPQNTSFMLSNDNALKGVGITLEYDKSFFDVKPLNGNILQGYVMATAVKPEGRKSIVSGIPQLVDYLRDPPGGNSSAYLEAGSKLSYTYNADLAGSAGVTFNLVQGQNSNTYQGLVVIPSFGATGTMGGTYMETKNKNVFSIDAITYYNQGWNFSYNFDVTERIQTSNAKKWVGGKADLFMGMTTDVMVADAIALRVVPDSLYQIYKTHEGGTFTATDSQGNTSNIKVRTGTAKVLVEGVDDTGKPVYLIRDEVLALGPKLASTFVHSQHYIENELLPELINLRNSLILPKGTTAAYAKALANKKGYPTYVSRVAEDDVSFGYKDSYDMFEPDGGLHGDSIQSLNQTVEAWLNILAENERQKIEVSENDLVKRYDMDGGANIQYSESFSATQTDNRSLRYPGINDLGQVTTGLLSILKTFVEAAKHWNEINGADVDNKPLAYTALDFGGNGNLTSTIEIATVGTYLSLKIVPAISLNFTDKSGMSKSNSKKIGFTLSTSSKSSLTVDVYRTANEQTMKTAEGSFGAITADILDMLRTGKLGSNPMDYLGNSETVYSSFVYRTRGGVTCEPYEGERTTKWYQPGTVVDVATIPADKPRIWIDEPMVSNVPFDQPARFTLHMANESDYPERASLIFNYFLLASSNPDGAKVLIDGTPMNSQGVNIVMYPCRDKSNEVTVFTKQIEVWPGKEFDYNNLTLCLYDPEDANRVFECKFSAHFVPTAGKVNVSSPSYNWVMNTESPYDSKRKGRYIPVRIDGFDTNYRGFDHIELQYKLSTQGDNDWVNVCSYYADKELMSKVSGVTDTIPGDGIIMARFYGETDPIEQYYDLRAVNYCRHGNGFLTGMSPVLKGIKDTRVPTLFGTPEPLNGILGIGDDLKLTFSEPIAGNYLSKINNFELLGTPTSQDISTSTSLSFNSDWAMCYTQGYRNLTGKSFTVDIMLNPATDKGDMDVFIHGGNNGVRFGVSADMHLTATVNGTTVESDTVVAFNNALHQVAYALDQTEDNMKITFFDQSKAIGTKTISGNYENSASFYLGRDFQTDEKRYYGEMLEFRLWNRAMTQSELDAYSKKRLTGYESGLLNYYPLNEGKGEFAFDKAPSGMDLSIEEATWKRPNGISMKFDGTKGMLLNKNPFVRSSQHDYTLMFWFRTNEENGTLFASGDATQETKEQGRTDELNIGLKNGALYLRSAGWEMPEFGRFSDGEWHHYAMTVSRSRNVANIYVDQKMRESFAADSLAGIDGDSIALGATYVNKEMKNVLKGNIDEVGMFESVLPMNLINEFSTHTPIGTMSSLKAYLDFGRSMRQDDNTMRLEPTGISLKRYKTTQGITSRRDTLVIIEPEFVDRSQYAPMNSNSQLDNLKYNYVANDNQLLVNIQEPDYVIEKTNVYLTVKEVPDLQGNLMASPVTMNVYVYQNPLRWSVKSINEQLDYGKGADIDVKVTNLSGQRQNFELKDLPVWITASKNSGVIDALGEQTITFHVSPFINIGNYTEQVELSGDSYMSEPLPIILQVRDDAPKWVVRDNLKEHNETMMMTVRVKIDGVVAHDTDDLLGAFDENLQTLGVAHIEVDNTANANEALAYLTIYGYSNKDKSRPKLNFKFFDASKGQVFTVEPADGSQYIFNKDTLIGSAAKPVVMQNVYYDMQTLKLKKGWNWVTFLVKPDKEITVGQFLNGSSWWEVGDKISTVDGTTKQKWTCRTKKKGNRGYMWDDEDELIQIHPDQMYAIYSVSDKTVYFEGLFSYDDVTVHQGWNRLGYVSRINLPIAQAMSGYVEEASVGDIIKSQDAFAVATSSNTGIVWKGTLQYMEAGQGYMLKRLGKDEVKFGYPIYWSDNRYSGDKDVMAKAMGRVTTLNTMNIVASVGGVQPEEGDHLVVYIGAAKVADAVADDEQNYYLNIGSDDKSETRLTFALERDGEIVAMTASQMTYTPNMVLGTPDQPTEVDFTALDQIPNDGNWYTLGGIRLNKKPAQTGYYIYNGKAVFVK